MCLCVVRSVQAVAWRGSAGLVDSPTHTPLWKRRDQVRRRTSAHCHLHEQAHRPRAHLLPPRLRLAESGEGALTCRSRSTLPQPGAPLSTASHSILYMCSTKSEETTCNDLTGLLLNRIRLSDSSLIEVAKGCRKLKTLRLRYCTSVSDAALAQLFTFCTQLSCLDLFCCNQITGKCLEAGGTVALRRLYIQDCTQVSINSTRQNQNKNTTVSYNWNKIVPVIVRENFVIHLWLLSYLGFCYYSWFNLNDFSLYIIYLTIAFGRERVQDARAQHRHHTPQLETKANAQVDRRLHSEQAQVACWFTPWKWVLIKQIAQIVSLRVIQCF